MTFSFLDSSPVLKYNYIRLILFIVLPRRKSAGGKESGMAQAKMGDTVRVHYTGMLDDGTVFDSSIDGEPLRFMLGQGRVLPGFDEMIHGMTVGDKKTEKIEAARAYGPYLSEMVMAVDRANFPPAIAPEVGVQLRIQVDDKPSVLVEVTEVGEASIRLDANHPLAGRDLIFAIELVEIL
jgi:peptidylprolyl isomerase